MLELTVDATGDTVSLKQPATNTVESLEIVYTVGKDAALESAQEMNTSPFGCVGTKTITHILSIELKFLSQEIYPKEKKVLIYRPKSSLVPGYIKNHLILF